VHAGAEETEDIWGCIAEAHAPEKDHSNGILLWTLSRSLKRLTAANCMGELALPPGMEQISSSSSDAMEGRNINDLSSLGTPMSSSASSLASSPSSPAQSSQMMD
jgi:hypothetical protein